VEPCHGGRAGTSEARGPERRVQVSAAETSSAYEVTKEEVSDTNGVFSVVELVPEPGQGASLHVHTHEDELVYVVDGQLEVTLGDQKMTATAGVLALLPRGIPHGFTNTGGTPSRLLDVILPGTFDNYFVALHNLFDGVGVADEAKLNELAETYGIRYL
jgi:quercetin dioxygenase-like cupin family protein